MKPALIRSDLDPDLALKGYTKDPEWMYKTGLGGTISAACALVAMLAMVDARQFFFLPVAFALLSLTTGFVLRTIRARVIDPQAKLADWNGWIDLFMSGITWLAIQFGILVIAAMILTTGLLLAAAIFSRDSTAAALISELAVVFVVSVLLWTSLLSSYLMVNFAIKEKLSAGFAIAAVIRGIRQQPKLFLAAWALSCALQVCSVIGPIVTVIGIFLVPSTFFAGQVISATMLAQAWRSTEEPGT